MSTPQFLRTGYLKTPKRSSFDMSHTHLTTTNFGSLNVVLSQEVLPNDSWKMRQSALVRFLPILAPVLSRMDVKFYWFFTPNRLIYKDWEDFISPTVEDTISYDRTISVSNGYTKPYTDTQSIVDYYDYISENSAAAHAFVRFLGQIGLPFNEFYANPNHNVVIDLLPIMAYQRIWYDYFRDENLDDPTPMPTHGGHYVFDFANPTSADSLEFIALFTPRVKSWDKDYFTSALPFAQKGPKVTIPIGQSADVKGTSTLDYVGDTPLARQEAINKVLRNGPQVPAPVSYADWLESGTTDYWTLVNGDYISVTCYANPENQSITYRRTDTDQAISADQVFSTRHHIDLDQLEIDNDLRADLTTATATTIDQFRTLFQLQRFFERAALVGTRYIELLKGFFGVTSSDARLQRAEYLGGCRIPIISNEVFSNTETINSSDEIVNPVGSYAGKANAFGGDAPIKRFFEEHGYLTCLMVCVPKTAYYQGIPRRFTDRQDYTQYFWPQFAHLGEQEVHNSELFYEGNDEDKEPFGYQSRYVEYKFIPDQISGSFRPTLNGGLNLSYWHLGRNFDQHQLLNDLFVHIDSTDQDLNRIFAVTDVEQDNIMCQIEFDITAIRAMPVFAEQFLSTSI